MDTKKRLHEVALDWQVLKSELIEIGAALDDPRTDLSMTMAEVIRDLKKQLASCEKMRGVWSIRAEAHRQACVAAERAVVTAEKERDEYLTECRTLTRQNGEWLEMVAACQQYLKEGETPAERMARYHHDIQGVLGQLATAMEQRDELREALEHILEYWNGDNNATAMHDALTHIDDVCRDVLSTHQVITKPTAWLNRKNNIAFIHQDEVYESGAYKSGELSPLYLRRNQK